MNSTPYSATEAPDCFEACLNSSYSTVCHRTRQQLKDKICASRNVNTEIEVAETLLDIINNVSNASRNSTLQHTPLRVAQTGKLSMLHSPSTVIQIEECNDVPSASPNDILHYTPPRVIRSGKRSVLYSPSTVVQIEECEHEMPLSVPRCDPSPILPSENIEMALFLSDTEVRDLFSVKNSSAMFDLVKLLLHSVPQALLLNNRTRI
ncbi:hypothetical protein CDAR_288611 [Caerostris darwini]|uniref:Uncharacterized protein n=1 Tax=Caerostris darwini TaxID=1538125 RepID=A0AAV4RS16_9ARAC|nr:hypothetical protein CDAR_288611 [Caerostris darwini]